jgi:hypothetical protein
MKKLILLLSFLMALASSDLHAQIEKVIVERYYVSDSLDATDTTGGYLEPGSVTYRIFIDMYPGCTLQKIYGDANHPFRIASTEKFFNNKLDGQTFAKDFLKARYGENTVALDSWLTLGQTTRLSTKTSFGVLKSEDRNGSFIGGSNNDGGSAGIVGGLLTNSDASAGIPITTSDGMDTMNSHPTNWANYGDFDFSTTVDSTIFGSAKEATQFVSNDAGLQNSGISGVNTDSNQVLVAQLTTKGEISFELNVEILDTNGVLVKYVAKDTLLASGEVFCRFLTYPYVSSCGCPDPKYLEYLSSRDCDNHDSCKTRIIFGCMDPLSCNYDPTANYNVPSLCCYPGYCNDRNISVVCPELTTGKLNVEKLKVYPNPTTAQLNFDYTGNDQFETLVEIYNSTGQLVHSVNYGIISSSSSRSIDLSTMENGIYLFRLTNGEYSHSQIITKQ